MEVLSPSPPPTPDRYGSWFVRRGICGGGGGDEKLYVAVGRSPEKTLSLLRWAFRRFSCREIGLLHVHQPSPVIPTLLGKIPANQANEDLVSSYRTIEWEVTRKILHSYQSYCKKYNVEASVSVIKTDQIQSGIVDLVNQHGVRKLVMGAMPDNCFKLKGSYSKAAFAAKNAPSFCEIWFIFKGRHIWTREASEVVESFLSRRRPDESLYRERFALLPQNDNLEQSIPISQSCNTINSLINVDLGGSSKVEQSNSIEDLDESTDSNILCRARLFSSQVPESLCLTLPRDTVLQSEAIAKGKLVPDILHDHLKEVTKEVERSRKEAFAELIKRKQVEAELAETACRAKAFEAAREHEIENKLALGKSLITAKLKREDLLLQKNEALRQLQNTMETVATLKVQAQEIVIQQDEAAVELDLLHSSLHIIQPHEGKKEERSDDIGELEKLNDGNEGVEELQQQYKTDDRPVPPFFLCPILQEIMHDPQVAADGFTYDARALREWFDKGHDTSPMTNLKLKHLSFTPNHALKSAIQDWLCQS